MTCPAIAQLRVVSYNTAAGGPNPGLATVLEAIGNDTKNGIAKPIDVLALQEQASWSTTTQQIVDILNGIYGTGTYDLASPSAQPGSDPISAGPVLSVLNGANGEHKPLKSLCSPVRVLESNSTNGRETAAFFDLQPEAAQQW